MKRALAHLFNRLLSICYRGWVSLIELSHIEREQKQKRAVAMMTMRGCVRYPNSNPAPAPDPGPDPDPDSVPNPKSTLNPNPNPNPNPNQVRCFVAWLGHVNEMRALRQRAMAHFSGNLAFFAFSAWRTFQAEQRERHKNFGIRMRRGGEWRALCKWVAFREAKLERARQRLQAEEEAAAAEAAEVADEEARLSRAQEMERLRAMANDCAERQAEAVAQLEEAAVQAHEAERARGLERGAESAALRRAEEQMEQQKQAWAADFEQRGAAMAEAQRGMDAARAQLMEAAEASARATLLLEEDRRLMQAAVVRAAEERAEVEKLRAEEEATRAAGALAAAEATARLAEADSLLAEALEAARGRDAERGFLSAAMTGVEAQLEAMRKQEAEDLLGSGGPQVAFEETATRLRGVEAQLEQLKLAVRRTEQQLAPLPLEHLDAAAAQLQNREMQALREGLEEQRRGMHELRSTKAYHHELEAAREQFARFLFHHPQRGGLPPPPPPREVQPLGGPPLGAPPSAALARGAALDLDGQLDVTGTHRRGFDQPPPPTLTPRLSALTPLPLMGASHYPDPPSSIEPTAAEAPPQPPSGPRPARHGRPVTSGGGTALAAWSSPRSSPRAHLAQDAAAKREAEANYNAAETRPLAAAAAAAAPQTPRARPSTVVGGQGGGKASRAAPPQLRLDGGAVLPQFSSSAR